MPLKHEVRITATAKKDLKEIFSFIAVSNPLNATKFIEFLLSQVGKLETFPTRCPLAPENQILGTQYRHLIYGDYRTIFEVIGGQVIVLRIIHGSRLIDDGMLY